MNKFLEKFPINADEIFSFEESCKRDNIMFNPYPQITWDLTKGRFHGKVKIEDEFREHSDTIEIIREWSNVNAYLDYCKERDAYFAKYDNHVLTFIDKVGWSVSDSVEPNDE